MADFASIEPLEQRARTAESKASAAAGNVPTLVQKLTEAVQKRYADSPLIKQREGAASTLMSTPDQVRSEIGDKIAGGTILNPNQQQAMISSRQAANIVPLMSLNDLLNAQFGTGRDIIESGTGAFKAEADAAANEAKLARATSDSAFNRIMQQAALDLDRAKLAASQATSPYEQAIMEELARRAGIEDGTTGGGATDPSTYQVGDVFEDDATGKRYTWDGTQMVEQAAPQNPNIFQKLFGGADQLGITPQNASTAIGASSLLNPATAASGFLAKLLSNRIMGR